MRSSGRQPDGRNGGHRVLRWRDDLPAFGVKDLAEAAAMEAIEFFDGEGAASARPSSLTRAPQWRPSSSSMASMNAGF